jgi:hypothetical protein
MPMANHFARYVEQRKVRTFSPALRARRYTPLPERAGLFPSSLREKVPDYGRLDRP